MTKYVLLIWEEIPENNKMFLIPSEIASEYQKYLEQAHGKFINADSMNEGLEFLNMAVADPDYEWDSDLPFVDKVGIFKNYLWVVNEPITGKHIEGVYLSGFML